MIKIKQMIKNRSVAIKCILLLFLVFCFVGEYNFTYAQINALPDININIANEDGTVQVANTVQILLVLTVLSIAPSILMMMTCFTRIIIVLGFIRRALSLQSTPPNQVLVGLALFMTFFIMTPVFSNVYETAYTPLQEGTITLEQAVDIAKEPFKDFMLRQVRTKDLSLFLNVAGVSDVRSNADIPMTALIPAFIISELKVSFEIGFLIFIPFIVVDMIVASTLMALGMMMLPPVMISLPIKILLFIMVDGWHLLVEKLILSVR